MIETKFSEESIKRLRIVIVCFMDNLSDAAEAFRKAIQKAEENRKEQLERYVALFMPIDPIDKLEDIKIFADRLGKAVTKIEIKNDLRQNWKHDTYRTKLHSRISSKRISYHNCRNNLKRRYKIEY